MRKIALLSLLLLLLANITGCATMKKMMWWEDDEEQAAETQVAVQEEPTEVIVKEVTVTSYHPRHATKVVNGERHIVPALPSNVVAAKKSIQDRYVTMQGSVYYDGFAKSYVILDNTGVMPIDLEADDFSGLNFDKNDVVRVTGEVQVEPTGFYPSYIIDYVEIIKIN